MTITQIAKHNPVIDAITEIPINNYKTYVIV